MTKRVLTLKNIRRVVNARFLPLLDYFGKRLVVMYGGAGSGKSVASSQIMILSMMQGRNQLVVRKVARTHRFSVFAEARKTINQLKLNKFFQVSEHKLYISCISGAEAYFVGCDDVEKLKSIVPARGIFDDIHIEEATELSLNDFYVIDTRQRGQSGKPRRIFLRFNPIYKHHWIYKEFFETDKWGNNILKHHSTYKDNRFLDKQDIEKYENYKNIDPYMYNVYTLGNWGLLGERIFDFKVVPDDFDIAGDTVYGLDFGYVNPSAFVRVKHNPKEILVCDEVYEKGLTNKDIALEVLPLAGENLLYCDSAEPKSVDELCSYGLYAVGAKKGGGTVLSGIKFMKSKRIYVKEKCVNVRRELETYHRKKDKDGNVLETPVKENDHSIDAIRYALSDAIWNYLESVGTNVGYAEMLDKRYRGE